MIDVNQDNYFEVAIALWYWLSHWHDGQWSDKYSAMSTMQLSNVPSIEFEDDDGKPIYSLDEDDEDIVIRYIYHELNENNWEQCNKDLKDILKNLDD